ncbi:MAG TPA: segregation/condensation protein A, partial [Candidatus Paceibacterota bacterium]|nr:segregation/condensation protein A [Candidatus Paceibacterota bacterium]
MSEIVSPYNLKTDKFEGPLELLLSLIEDRKFFVNEISLASVTDDYLKYIKSLSEIDNDEKINNISSFILTAATLILVKSRSLLPNISLTEDEKENINDLELRLKLYEIIKRASLDIKNDFGKKIIFKPEDRIWSLPVFSPDPLINKNNIAKIIDEVINQLP